LGENTHSDSSSEKPAFDKITQKELESVLALWALFKRIQQIKDNDKRDSAEVELLGLAKLLIQ